MAQNSFLKSLLGAKMLMIVAALALHQGWIHFGDLPLRAAEGKATDGGDKKPDAAEAATAAKPEPAKSAAPKDALAAAEEEKAKGEEGARRSFLSDLFTLPKLNAKQVQKEEIGKYMDMAERKERQVDERTAQLSKRENQLKALEKSIDDKLGKLEDERKFIAKTIQQEKDLKGERVDKIAELFDKMEPKKAASAFEKLDKDLTVILFKKLKQKQVTTILENMSPEKSVELTEYFARVKSAKEYDILKELNESLRKEFQDCKGMPTASAAEPVQAPDATKK
jgi:flagellar motility protein MotE (MotC chaperone)